MFAASGVVNLQDFATFAVVASYLLFAIVVIGAVRFVGSRTARDSAQKKHPPVLRAGVAWKFLNLFAGSELERGQPGIEIEAARCLVVFLCVPEGAVVGGVDRHAAVITPAIRAALLDSGSGHDGFCALHLAQHVR